MNYHVIWSKKAEDALASSWLNASDRTAIAKASDEIDRLLADAPLGIGESRASSLQRIHFLEPLGVLFDVIEDDKKVIVQLVWPV